MKSFRFNLWYQCPDTQALLSHEYIRSAPTARQAVLAALAELRELIPQGYLVSVGPDLVGLSEVAQLFGLNQKNMRLLMAKYGAAFPTPRIIGNEPAWHSADILGLLAVQGLRDIPETDLEMAQFTRAMNRVLAQRAN